MYPRSPECAGVESQEDVVCLSAQPGVCLSGSSGSNHRGQCWAQSYLRLMTSLEGTMVLDAERAVWRAQAMALSIDLLDLHANWSGSNESGRDWLRWWRFWPTTQSRGLWTFWEQGQWWSPWNVGTTDWSSDMLKMSVKTSASWSAHTMRARPRMPTGPGPLLGLIHLP